MMSSSSLNRRMASRISRTERSAMAADNIGSLTEVASGAGNPKGSFEASPYGQTRLDEAPTESRKFANSVRDPDVGLDHMGARYYASDLGVWTSPDPVLIDSPPDYVGAHPSQSAYSYANSNPNTKIDKDGRWAIIPMIVVVVAVVATAQYANAPTSPNAETYHKGTAELALDMAHNASIGLGAAGAPRALACVTRQALSGGVKGALSTGAKVAGGAAATEGAGRAADNLDPSGNARKVVDIGASLVVNRTKCFAEGTPVATCQAGQRPIEILQPGDQVVARDPRTGETGCREVLAVSERSGAELLELTLNYGASTETLRVTPGHPLWIAGQGWLRAAEVALGAEVSTATGLSAELVSARTLTERAPVFNLVVDQFHTYFVGEAGLWVHNGCHGGGETLSRLGTSRESARRLARKAAEAETSKIKIHGVSTTAGKPKGAASQASRHSVEGEFKVHDTPSAQDPLHRTVELPKPVTQQIADTFNRLFGRSK